MTKNEYIVKKGSIYRGLAIMFAEVANVCADVAIACAETDGVSHETTCKYIDMAREYNNMASMCVNELEKVGKDYE